MIDIIYVVGTVAFFGVMLLYVRACEKLGHMASADVGEAEEPQS